MKKCLIGLFLLVGATLQQASAVTLWEVYQQALGSDPTFKAAQESYLATKENIPIARAALLPNINLTGATQRSYEQDRLAPIALRLVSHFYNTNNNYALNLTQAIFNYSAWYTLRNQDYNVRQAQANFVGAAQSLMLRTAQAYFSVLQANDTLRYTIAQKLAVKEQLKQTQQQYDVGLVPITGVKEAQANYDSLVSREIAARNNLAVAVEALRIITGRAYPSLMGTNDRLPLLPPRPANIVSWVKASECQNYELLAAIYGANAAEENIKVQQGGHFPVISGTGSLVYNENTDPIVNAGILDSKVAAVGFQVNMPIYQGGQISAQARQAEYQYQQAISNMEFAHRGAIEQTRDAFFGVISGISKIQADRQAVASNIASLAATRQGYMVGTRTILDVLNVEAALYQAQQNYSIDQYNYLNSILNLKQAAGTIGPDDLGQMSAWLSTNYEIAAKIAGIEHYGQPLKIATESSNRIIANANAASKQQYSEQTTVAATPIHKKTTVKNKKNNSNNDVTAGKTYYSIALFDTRYKQHAIDFISDHGLQSKGTYLAAKNAAGQMRYQVIYGNYDSLIAAEAAMKKLSPNLQALNPWVKEVK